MLSHKQKDFIEAVTNLISGYLISVLITITLFPLMGIEITLGQASYATVVFSIASVWRSFTLRRIFRLWN